MTIQPTLTKLREKLGEALASVMPIIGIVLILCFTAAPLSPSVLLSFLLGAAMIVVGIMFFTLGTEISMTPMGERTGAAMTRSRRLWLVVLLSFILGFIITISEPDLQVLAQQVPSIPNRTLILCVAAGVGFFLVVALLRMLFGIPLPHMLVGFYAIVFLLVPLVPKSFLAVAFDSGGVTTGPMTVPFIMALGVGISATRNDRHAADDSFGLVALCSIGPILAVMVLGMIYRPQESAYTVPLLPEVGNSAQLGQMFWHAIPTYLGEIALSLAPIILFFGILRLSFLQQHHAESRARCGHKSPYECGGSSHPWEEAADGQCQRRDRRDAEFPLALGLGEPRRRRGAQRQQQSVLRPHQRVPHGHQMVQEAAGIHRQQQRLPPGRV